jgi:RNA polymerase sigma-70 factor (ECF subfamily)
MRRTKTRRLPHDLKTALLLHHYEQLSYREIGSVVGCSERGVETRLYRARQRLREELAGFLRETAAV